MKKIFAIALALMLAIPALAFADGNDADLARYQNMLFNDDSGFVPFAEYKKK